MARRGGGDLGWLGVVGGSWGWLRVAKGGWWWLRVVVAKMLTP